MRTFLVMLGSAAPGLLIMAAGFERPGLAVALLGAFIGFCLCLERVSPARVARLFFAMLIAKNVPGMEDKLWKYVDEARPPVEAEPDYDPSLGDWLVGIDVQDRRPWVIWIGFAAGVLSGIATAVHDVWVAWEGTASGWFLPWDASRDSLPVQGVLLAILFTIWGGAIGAIVASGATRRIVLVIGVIGGIFGLALGVAGSNDLNDPRIPAMCFACTTAGVLLGLIIAIICNLPDPNGGD
jgi:ABC-type amino acid transport system permease subunit